MKILLFKSHGNDPLSAAIKNVTQSDYCHAAILVDAGSPWRKVFAALCVLRTSIMDDAIMIVEEYWPKARARFLSAEELADIDVFEIAGWTADNEFRAMQYAAQVIREEVKYDIPDLFRFLPVARMIMGVASEDAAKRHMFCSYFAFEMCKAAGRQLLRTTGCETSPNMLAWPMDVVPAQPLQL